MNEDRIVGIFDADGGWRGELRYASGVIAGNDHCSLCDITHGFNPWGKPAWKRACAEVPFDIELIHRDKARPAQLQAAATLPAVVAGSGDSWRLLVDSDQLKSCRGDPHLSIALIQAAVG